MAHRRNTWPDRAAADDQVPQGQPQFHDVRRIAPAHADDARSALHPIRRIDLEGHAIADLLRPETEIYRQGRNEQQREDAGEGICHDSEDDHGAAILIAMRLRSGEGCRRHDDGRMIDALRSPRNVWFANPSMSKHPPDCWPLQLRCHVLGTFSALFAGSGSLSSPRHAAARRMKGGTGSLHHCCSLSMRSGR